MIVRERCSACQSEDVLFLSRGHAYCPECIDVALDHRDQLALPLEDDLEVAARALLEVLRARRVAPVGRRLAVVLPIPEHVLEDRIGALAKALEEGS